MMKQVSCMSIDEMKIDLKYPELFFEIILVNFTKNENMIIV